MDSMEKTINLKLNENYMSLTLNTFLSILFEDIKMEIPDYSNIKELNDKLELIQKVITLVNKNDEDIFIDLDKRENEELLISFSYGLYEEGRKLVHYANN